MRVARALVLVIIAAAVTAGAAQDQPRLTRIEFRPATIEEGGGIVISLLGTGRCTYKIDFGDGQAETRTADLPDTMRHAYAGGREYEVVATPEAPCEGVGRARIDVRAIERGIWRLQAQPASVNAPDIVLTIDGRGYCPVFVDFGDGQREKHEVTLPARLNHRYAKDGAYQIQATTQDPCRGEGRIKVEIK
jgi:hypothetical protein